MAIILKETGSNYTPPPEGTHLAICFRIVDLGVQPDSGFGERHKLCLSWELPNETVKTDQGEKPMGVSKTYTFSLNSRATLRTDLTRWRGRDFTPEELKGFSLSKILGKPCQLSVIHETKDGKVRGRIDGVFAAPKGMPVPAPVNPLVEYSLEQGKDKVYAALPEWIRKMVDAGLAKLAEQQAEPPVEEPPQAEAPEAGEDIPF